MKRTLPAVLLCLLAPLTLAQQPPQPPPRDPAEGGVASVMKSTSEAAAPAAVGALDTRPFRWRAIGPANMGGRVSDFAVVEKNPSTIYVATGTGGLFRTNNNGTTWEGLFDKQPVASIGAVAVSQNNPKLLWVGTGEGNNRNSSSWGNGIYKSADGGETWTNVGLPDSKDIPRIALDPKNDDVVYAAVLGHLWGSNKERGLYKTSDGGKSWQQVLAVDENTGAIDVIVDPSNSSTVYAAMWARVRSPYSFIEGGTTGGVFKSIDAGKTWKKLTDGLPAETGRIGLDIYRKNPKTLFAVLESDVGGAKPLASMRSRSGGVFRSDDAGAHWRRVSDIVPRGFYFGKIRVDPNDDNRVYVLGFSVAVSDDGGKTFLNTGARNVHADCHAMWIDPANSSHVLLGTDGGIYFSYDKARTWDFRNNLPLGEFYNVAYGFDTPYTICGGLQDNGTWCGPSSTRRTTRDEEDDPKRAGGITNADWFFINGGDGFYAAIDPTDPNILYGESQGGYISRIDMRSGKRRFLKPEAKEGTPDYRFNWNAPFVISHYDPKTLYFGGNVLFRFTNRGDNWEQISPDLTARDVNKILTAGSAAENYGTIVAISESPKDRNVLWVGTDDGNVQVTRDGGKNWTNVTNNISAPRGLWVSRVEASNHDAARAYVAIDGHRSDDYHTYLFATDDYGQTWRSIVSDLPADQPVKGFREDPVNARLLFAGTEFAPYFSVDGGAHWQSLKENLPTVSVDDLQIHPREHDLIIATHGRSVWILDDISALEQMTPEKMNQTAVLFDPRPATEYYELPIGGMWGQRDFKGKNAPAGAVINYWLKGDVKDDVSISIENAAGTKIRELEATNRPGLNRVTWDLHPEPLDAIGEDRGGGGGGRSQTRFVPPGDYAVKMKVGDKRLQTKVTVRAEEGVHAGEFESNK